MYIYSVYRVYVYMMYDDIIVLFKFFMMNYDSYIHQHYVSHCKLKISTWPFLNIYIHICILQRYQLKLIFMNVIGYVMIMNA